MKYIGIILIGVVVGAGSAFAASVGKSVIKAGDLWGFVGGERSTYVYRLKDTENKTVCYVAYTNDGRGNYFPEMECVKL